MKVLITIFILTVSIISYSQDKAEANLILLVDDQLVVGSIADIKMINSGRTVEAFYYPGRLIFEKQAYSDLISSKDSLQLVFDYYEQDDGKQRLYNYKLPFNKRWLNEEYVILKIYNLNKSVYKKRFDPLDSKRNYTFEITSPGGQMLRVKKKKKKN